MSAAPTFRESAATDEAAQAGLLYERYARQLQGFCRARLSSREEAEDAVQHTFLNAYRSLRSGTRPRAEAAWMFAIAANVCRERRRSAWRRSRIEVVSDDGLVGERAAPEHSHEELTGVADALAELTPNQRRAILLREWQGLSYREIADELSLTEGAVETLLFRARRSLARKLDRSRGRVVGPLEPRLGARLGQALCGGTAAKSRRRPLVVAAGVTAASPCRAAARSRRRCPRWTRAIRAGTAFGQGLDSSPPARERERVTRPGRRRPLTAARGSSARQAGRAGPSTGRRPRPPPAPAAPTRLAPPAPPPGARSAGAAAAEVEVAAVPPPLPPLPVEVRPSAAAAGDACLACRFRICRSCRSRLELRRQPGPAEEVRPAAALERSAPCDGRPSSRRPGRAPRAAGQPEQRSRDEREDDVQHGRVVPGDAALDDRVDRRPVAGHSPSALKIPSTASAASDHRAEHQRRRAMPATRQP